MRIFPFLAALAGPIGTTHAEDFIFRHDNTLGTSMEMQVRAVALEDAKLAEKAALSEIERLEKIFSTYDPDSVISKFAQAPLHSRQYLPREFLEALVASDWWKAKTGGAFNPLAEECSLLWKRHADANTFPSNDSIATATQRISQAAWEIDPTFESAIRIQSSKMSLNAIAKGYIIDRACEAARNATSGIDSVLLSIGGDLRVIGSVKRSVGIANPAAPADNAPPLLFLELHNHSAATSANYARGFEIQGKRYSHIIDPRSGYPVAGKTQSASVIAETATQADALSTTLMVLSPDEGIALIESLPDTECLLVSENEAIRTSSNFDALVKREVDQIIPATPLKNEYELRVEFEINRPDTRRYERPYIAIWIEDAHGKPVKTLCLWMQLGSTYYKKLSRWNRLANKDWDQIKAITRATRMPGEYTLVWDGTADDGTKLSVGSYAIFIEAVRERGTHKIIREEFSLGPEPFERELDGNLEIKSATLRYGLKQN